ncbi:MAG: cysteine desulfurase NifS, partial [Acetatifactor sp.]|nr:cysteine desulfurase NifS [Acetatifactor sp.]
MIYLDNAATTRMAPEVLDAMLPFFADNYGNPSTIYGLGAKARRAVAEAREHVSALMGAKPEEIYFTSGGTEADNWAIKAVAEAYTDKGKHIITTKIEHHAVLHTCKWLERQGFEVTYLDVDKDGLVHVEDVREALRPDTILISVMFANNEIGTIEPIAEIGALAHEHNILFHTDAVQAFGQIPVDVKAMNVDLLSASAHKVNGPKGVGCLYIRSDVKIRSFLHGGAQERSRRAGTENVPGIVGFGEAARRAARILPEKQKREQSLRDYLIDRLESEVPWCRLNGHRSRRLPGNVNFSFSFVEGESLLIRLDMEGICVSSGSACTSGSLDPSHVLLAIGLKHEEAHGSLRFTLSEENTK